MNRKRSLSVSPLIIFHAPRPELVTVYKLADLQNDKPNIGQLSFDQMLQLLQWDHHHKEDQRYLKRNYGSLSAEQLIALVAQGGKKIAVLRRPKLLEIWQKRLQQHDYDVAADDEHDALDHYLGVHYLRHFSYYEQNNQETCEEAQAFIEAAKCCGLIHRPMQKLHY